MSSRPDDSTREHEGHPDDPPGAVSNQNQETAESALRDDEQHPEPRTRGNGQQGSGNEGAGDEGPGDRGSDA